MASSNKTGTEIVFIFIRNAQLTIYYLRNDLKERRQFPMGQATQGSEFYLMG